MYYLFSGTTVIVNEQVIKISQASEFCKHKMILRKAREINAEIPWGVASFPWVSAHCNNYPGTQVLL